MNIRDLIRDYQAAAKDAAGLLIEAYGHRDLLRASRDGRVPRHGNLGDAEFSFHGVGLRVTWPNREVDLDFGPEDRADGFDAWRLSLYAESLPGSDPSLHHQRGVQPLLDELVASGEIVKPEVEPSPHLYFWVGASPHIRK